MPVNMNFAKKKFLGRSLPDAQKIAVKKGLIIRVVEEDGEHHIGTCDLRLNRINVIVEQGKIIGLSGIG